jgi:hypothetical protein
MVSSDEPVSFAEVERNPSWRKVIMEEMLFIEENNTWSLINLSSGRNPARVKWVFMVKRDEHEAVSKHKVRLVVKGYVHQHDINCDEVFMIVARLDSVRLLIALMTHEGWEVHPTNVKSTFLNDGM